MRDVQDEVEALAARLDCAVLVEDARHRPLWWSTQGQLDGTRMRTILLREPPPAAAALVARLGLAAAEAPVRTPAVPEADMDERWCVPLRERGRLLGYLWVVDAEGRVGEAELGPVLACAELAAATLAGARPEGPERERRRTMLLLRLQYDTDVDAARELAVLEDLAPQAKVAVSAPAAPGGWLLPDGSSVHVDPAPGAAHTSGAPVPLADLAVASRRAAATQRALRAGARLAQPSWSALGGWRLIVDAPADLEPADLHPGADILLAQPRTDLFDTARSVLDHGGDVSASAAELRIHRTTLYYRLDRIAALAGVDLRAAAGRDDLHLALRLAAYRRA